MLNGQHLDLSDAMVDVKLIHCAGQNRIRRLKAEAGAKSVKPEEIATSDESNRDIPFDSG